jgi:hypothetical protein
MKGDKRSLNGLGVLHIHTIQNQIIITPQQVSIKGLDTTSLA